MSSDTMLAPDFKVRITQPLLITVSVISLALLSLSLYLWQNAQEDVPQPEWIDLAALPHLSEAALQQRGITYRITEPIGYYREADLALFEVEILDPNVTEPIRYFLGDAERFNGFVAELEFIKTHAGRLHLGKAGEGLGEGVTSLIEGIGDVLQHPMETAQGLADGAVALKDYAAKAVAGEADPEQDIKDLAQAFYTNQCSEAAAEAHFSYEEAVTEEARDLTESLVRWKLSGRAVSEIAMLLVPANSVKITKLSKQVAQGVKLTAKGSQATEKIRGYTALISRSAAFSQSAKILRSLTRLNHLHTQEQIHAVSILKHLLDPHKLSTLQPRGANPRLHKILYHLHQAPESGLTAVQLLDHALPTHSLGAHLPHLMRRQLLSDLDEAKSLGLFSDPANLQKMCHGKAPIIQQGPYRGEPLEVDHIIPIKHAPELGSNLANLRLLPRSLNQARKATLDEAAQRLIQDLKPSGWKFTTFSSPSLE